MSFKSYSVSLANVYDHSYRQESECKTIAETYMQIIDYLKRDHIGDVITVFYMDTESGPCSVEYHAFNAPYGWTFIDHLLEDFEVHIRKSCFDTYYKVYKNSYEGCWAVYEHPSFFICCNEALQLSLADDECSMQIGEVTNNRLTYEIDAFDTGIRFVNGVMY